MNKDKETKKLGAEELEKRVAPLAIYNQESETDQGPAGDDPTTPPDTGGGSGGAGNPPVVERPR